MFLQVSAYVQMCSCLCGTHRAGVSEVLVCHVRAGGADLPGVSKQLSCRLLNALPRGEVILCIPIKVTTQAPNPTPQVGCQAHIHTHTWR